MSWQCTSWALREANCPSAVSRLVLIALADRCQPDGRSAWPTIQTLSAEVHASRATVKRALNELERMGTIRRGVQELAKYDMHGQFVPKQYRPVVWECCIGVQHEPTSESDTKSSSPHAEHHVKNQRVQNEPSVVDGSDMTHLEGSPMNHLEGSESSSVNPLGGSSVSTRGFIGEPHIRKQTFNQTYKQTSPYSPPRDNCGENVNGNAHGVRTQRDAVSQSHPQASLQPQPQSETQSQAEPPSQSPYDDGFGVVATVAPSEYWRYVPSAERDAWRVICRLCELRDLAGLSMDTSKRDVEIINQLLERTSVDDVLDLLEWVYLRQNSRYVVELTRSCKRLVQAFNELADKRKLAGQLNQPQRTAVPSVVRSQELSEGEKREAHIRELLRMSSLNSAQYRFVKPFLVAQLDAGLDNHEAVEKAIEQARIAFRAEREQEDHELLDWAYQFAEQVFAKTVTGLSFRDLYRDDVFERAVKPFVQAIPKDQFAQWIKQRVGMSLRDLENDKQVFSAIIKGYVAETQPQVDCESVKTTQLAS